MVDYVEMYNNDGSVNNSTIDWSEGCSNYTSIAHMAESSLAADRVRRNPTSRTSLTPSKWAGITCTPEFPSTSFA